MLTKTPRNSKAVSVLPLVSKLNPNINHCHCLIKSAMSPAKKATGRSGKAVSPAKCSPVR